MRVCALCPSQLACTYSIVARDAATGQLGVAVQSHWFGVGRLVCWAEAGVGAVATQAMVQVAYGPRGLQRMCEGLSAREALAELLELDEGRDLRQVGMVDGHGDVAVHTGARCITEAGHEAGDGFCVQANMMANAQVWPAMSRAYQEGHGDLAHRLLAALDAAQGVGGDIRGKQSAAILVVKAEPSEHAWEDVLVDLRVEDHPQPLAELRRLVGLNRAYEHMNRGDALLAEKRVEEALAEYRDAARIAPNVTELPFWHAVTLADLDRLGEALPMFRDVFARDPNLALLLKRLPSAGLLRDDPEMMAEILSVGPGGK